jgi:hypothetical protein
MDRVLPYGARPLRPASDSSRGLAFILRCALPRMNTHRDACFKQNPLRVFDFGMHRIGEGLIRPKPGFGAWMDLSVPSPN